jgi:antitoxin HicB
MRPGVTGCVTYGETIDDTIAKEAVELSIKNLREKSEEIPTGEGVLEYTVDGHA